MVRRVRFADDCKAEQGRPVNRYPQPSHCSRQLFIERFGPGSLRGMNTNVDGKEIPDNLASALLAEKRAHQAMEAARSVKTVVRQRNLNGSHTIQAKSANSPSAVSNRRESTTELQNGEKHDWLDIRIHTDLMDISKTWIADIFQLQNHQQR